MLAYRRPILAGEPALYEIVMRRPRSQTFSRSTGFHATYEAKRIWRINSSIAAGSRWPFSTWSPLNELQGQVVVRAFADSTTAPERIL